MPKIISLLLVMGLVLLSGCSAKITKQEQDSANILFKSSNPNLSGLFIYRNSGLTGKTQVKSIWLDGQLVGELENKSYYYLEIPAGTHTLSTEAVFGNNVTRINTLAGKKYYVSQVFSQPIPGIGALWGAFISSARFEEVSEEDGQYRVLQCHQVMSNAKPAAQTTQPAKGNEI